MMTINSGSRWRFLIADDDATYRDWLRHHLGALCPEASLQVMSLTELLRRPDPVTQAECDLLLVSACFGTSPEDPRSAGLALLRELRGVEPLPAIIVVAEEGNELTAVRAIQLGASEYLPKRLLTPERLDGAIRATLKRLHMQLLPGRLAAAEAQIDWVDSTGFQTTDADTHDVGLTSEAALDLPVRPEPAAGPAEALGLPLLAALGFTVQKRLSHAEISSVYLAGSERWGEVAVKISMPLRDEETSRQLRERVYATLIAIQSPSVVTIHDSGAQDGLEYLVMEHLPRGNLKARLGQGLAVDEALHYTHAIADSLKIIHDAGVLHRDLKPANVMLREDDGIALIDFELTHTAEGMLRGSPYYMSPEHALGAPLDERSDFYSLGVMLYEMLTGRRPYTGASALEVLQAHVSAPLPELPPELSRYDQLLERLLAKDRNERFATAAQISAALTELRSAATLIDMHL